MAKIHRIKATRRDVSAGASALQEMQAKLIELQDENRDLRRRLGKAEQFIRDYEAELDVAAGYFDDEEDEDEEDEED